jgi:myotubularin-related protein 6/7/8
VLIEKDFCAFGHPFSMRCGSKGEGEAGPVFDQFLECVQSLRRGAPSSFEFTEALLALLKEHVYSRFFGNFLRDSDAERCHDDAVSLWRVVESDPGRFSSPVYDSSASRRLPVLSKPSADVELELLRARIRVLEK